MVATLIVHPRVMKICKDLPGIYLIISHTKNFSLIEKLHLQIIFCMVATLIDHTRVMKICKNLPGNISNNCLSFHVDYIYNMFLNPSSTFMHTYIHSHIHFYTHFQIWKKSYTNLRGWSFWNNRDRYVYIFLIRKQKLSDLPNVRQSVCLSVRPQNFSALKLKNEWR